MTFNTEVLFFILKYSCVILFILMILFSLQTNNIFYDFFCLKSLENLVGSTNKLFLWFLESTFLQMASVNTVLLDYFFINCCHLNYTIFDYVKKINDREFHVWLNIDFIQNKWWKISIASETFSRTCSVWKNYSCLVSLNVTYKQQRCLKILTTNRKIISKNFLRITNIKNVI